MDDSKVKSAEISKNLEENQEVEEVIEETRKAYIPVAIRGTILYFVVADLSGIDSMYQYSLAYYKRLFAHSIITSPKVTISPCITYVTPCDSLITLKSVWLSYSRTSPKTYM